MQTERLGFYAKINKKTNNSGYMLRLWTCSEGTMGLASCRSFPLVSGITSLMESVEQKTAWAFPPPVLPVSMRQQSFLRSHTFVAVEHEESLGFPDFLGKSMDSNCVTKQPQIAVC